jgi:hypothetical protein
VKSTSLPHDYYVEIKDAITNDILETVNMYDVQSEGVWKEDYFDKRGWTRVDGEYNDDFKFAVPRIKYLFKHGLINPEEILHLIDTGERKEADNVMDWIINSVFPIPSYFPDLLTDDQKYMIKDAIIILSKREEHKIRERERIFENYLSKIYGANEYFELKGLGGEIERSDLTLDQKADLNVVYYGKLWDISERTFGEYRKKILSPNITINDLVRYRDMIKDLPTYKKEELLKLVIQGINKYIQSLEERKKSIETILEKK